MVCPDKSSPHFKNQIEVLGDIRSFYLFNLNSLETPDLTQESAYKEAVNSYGRDRAMLSAYDAFVVRNRKAIKKSKKKEPVFKLLDFPFNEGGFLAKSAVTPALDKLIKSLNMKLNDSGNSVYVTMADGKVFFPQMLQPLSAADVVKAKKETIKKEKAWIKGKLGKDFPVDIAHRLVLGKAWGAFSKKGIELYESAPAGTGYHEAFHAVFNLGLNHGEREVIFAEVRGRKGNEKKSKLELEELLADEFSDYVTSEGKIDIPEVQKGVFARILNAIKQLFQTNISVEELYKGIDQGRFKELVLNPNEVNKFKVVNNEFRFWENGGFVDGKLSEKQTFDLMEGISNEMFQLMFTSDDPAAFFDGDGSSLKEIYSKVREKVAAKAREHIPTLTNREDQKQHAILYAATLGLDGFLQVDNSPRAEREWAKVAMHHTALVLPQYGMVAKGVDEEAMAKYLGMELDNDTDTEVLEQFSNTKDKAFDKASVEFDTKDGIPKAMKAILLGIGQKTMQGKKATVTANDKNSLGFNKMVPMSKIFAVFANTLHGNVGDYNAMAQSLKQLSKESKDFGFAASEMLNRLGGDTKIQLQEINSEDSIEDRIETAALNKKMEGLHRLRTQFTQAFSKTKYDFDIQLMDASGRLYTSDANSESLKKKIKGEATTDFRTKADRDENGNYFIPKANLQAAIEDLGRTDDKSVTFATQMFAMAVGMEVRDYLELADAIVELRDVEVEIGDYGTVTEQVGEPFSSKLRDALLSDGPFETITLTDGTEVEGIRDPYAKDSTIKGLINMMVEYKASRSSDTTENSHINPEGKRVFGVTLHSSMTTTAALMTSMKGDTEALQANMPQLYSTYSKNSVIKNDVERGRPVKIGIIEGVAPDGEAKGMTTSSLSPTDRIRQHIHSTLNGRYPFMRTADRSIENYVTTGRLLIQTPKEAEKIFRGYFIDEFNSIKDFKNGIGTNIKYYKNAGAEYRFFRDFAAANPELMSTLDKADNIETFFDITPKVRIEFDEALMDYFKGQVFEEEKYLAQQGLSVTDLGDEYAAYGENLMLMYVLNATAGNIEQTKLFLGDPAQYKSIADLFKRAAVYNGTKKISRTGKSYNDAANQIIPKTAMVNGEEVTFDYTDDFNAIVVEDIESSVENKDMLISMLEPKFGAKKAKKIAKGFEGYEEADAQGYVSLNGYREIMDRAGDWTNEHQNVFDKLKDNPDAKISAKEMTYFHPLKTQYAGPVKNMDGLAAITTVHKHSLLPLIPGVIKNNPLLKDLEKYMTENNITITEMASANKFGTITQDNGSMNKLVNDDGTFGLNAETAVMKNDFQYFGIQLDILGESKSKVGIGTQMTKELGANAYAFGKLQEGRDPEYTKKIQDYHDAYSNLIQYNTNKTMDAMGIAPANTLDNAIDSKGFEIKDFGKFKNYLKKMVDLKNADNNILDSIDTFETGDYIEYMPNSQSLESVLTSIVNNKIISTKVPGGAKVQVASTGFEVEINKEAAATGKYGSDRLQYYSKEVVTKDGKKETVITGAQVLLPHYFKEIAEDMGITDINDPRLKEIIGFRIPTQAPSSLELIEIAGFLPRAAGDMIVVPSEHVAKGGSDFDIDKLNIYLPAYDLVDGKPVYIDQNYSRGDKDFTKEKLSNAMLEAQIALLKDENYIADVVTPIDSENLKAWRDDINELKKTNEYFQGSLDTGETLSEVFMPRTNLKKFRDYLSGKAGVGQTALHVVHHSLGQLVGLHTRTDQMFKNQGTNGHFYDHHKDPRTGDAQLGGVTDVTGEYVIKDMISEFLNAYVDIAKDPYIFALNAGTQVANTIFYMLRTGADPNYVMHFVTQPSIVEYIKQTAIQESLYYKEAKGSKEKNQIIADVLSKFGADDANMVSSEFTRESILPHKNTKITLADLKKELKGKNTPKKQKLLLDQFLLYTEYARKLGRGIKASGVDTTGMGKNINKAQEMLDLHDEVVTEGFIGNHSELLGNTFLGEMQSAIRNYTGVYDKISIVKNPAVKGLIKGFKKEVRSNVKGAEAKANAEKMLDNEYVSYLIQTGIESHEFVNASTLETVRPKHKELFQVLKSPRFASNAFLQELVLDTNVGMNKEDVFKLGNRKLLPGEKNVLITDFQALYNESIDLTELGLEGMEPVNLGVLLTFITLNGAGIGTSPYGYSSTIPTEFFKLAMHNLIGDKLHGSTFSQFKEQFFRNNPQLAGKAPKNAKIDKKSSDQFLTVNVKSLQHGKTALVKYVYDAAKKTKVPVMYFQMPNQSADKDLRYKAYGHKGVMGNGFSRSHYTSQSEYNTYNVIDLSYLSEEDARDLKKKCEN